MKSGMVRLQPDSDWRPSLHAGGFARQRRSGVSGMVSVERFSLISATKRLAGLWKFRGLVVSRGVGS